MARSKTPDPQTITVFIFDKEYQVSCSKDEVSSLKKSAGYLDEKMREMKDSSSALRLDSLAVMAALNITNDLLTGSGKAEQFATQCDEISSLTGKVDTALSRFNSGRR